MVLRGLLMAVQNLKTLAYCGMEEIDHYKIL